MGEVLTMAEIEARYAPDWVLIADPQVDEATNKVVGGRVMGHGSDRDALFRRATELGLDYITVRYLGPWPEDMVFVL